MTEDQILQRVAESQKRVFSDIDSSKQGNASQGFQVVGANGLNVQQQGNQIAISGDTSALQGSKGDRGERGQGGATGPQGLQGPQGAGIISAVVNEDFSFTFTLTDGSTITTNALQTQSCN